MKSMNSKLPTAYPKPLPPPHIFKAPSQRGNQYTRALYDFSGAADKLLFRRGEEIAAISKVTDEWPVALAPRSARQPSSLHANDFEDADFNSRPMEHNDAGISSIR
ncbi:hypothetical protein BD626DRAFT_572253 [Schizophyllum amplum]|uniref:SH3 domain-containing protein n=1 Tax=Schizophyllum amplum TaxID=97359 RepID=A0A550C4X0_9AGAR|nr:hypothetical protein BD626DRAFT_572253 [Auriculariopsis ampla]